MKYIILFFIVLAFGMLSTVSAEEISLYDKEGNAIAYIDTNDDMTIYMWDGKPVAYLVKKNNSTNVKTDLYTIYGFNGKNLGWLNEGVLRDKKGCVAGFIKGAI